VIHNNPCLEKSRAFCFQVIPATQFQKRTSTDKTTTKIM